MNSFYIYTITLSGPFKSAFSKCYVNHKYPVRNERSCSLVEYAWRYLTSLLSNSQMTSQRHEIGRNQAGRKHTVQKWVAP